MSSCSLIKAMHLTRVRREYVASYPAGVLAFRMTANQFGKLNVDIALARSQNVASNAASSSGNINVITLKANGGIPFTAEARIVSDTGLLCPSTRQKFNTHSMQGLFLSMERQCQSREPRQ